MKNKYIFIKLFSTGIAICFFFLFYAKLAQDDDTPPLVGVSKSSGSRNYVSQHKTVPLHFKVPKIQVSASIESLGLTSSGAMDAPDGPDNVAWYEPGTLPGEKGSAVIAGHRGWKNGRSAVFDNLDKLAKGDKIYITNNKGVTITFVVRESRIYKPDQEVPEVFFSKHGRHLNIITCAGEWDDVNNSSTERLVVFSDRAY